MSLHYQWIRFRRECLRGRNMLEISAAKQMFYAGACAAADAIFKNVDPLIPSTPRQRRSLEALRQSLIRYQQEVMRK